MAYERPAFIAEQVEGVEGLRLEGRIEGPDPRDGKRYLVVKVVDIAGEDAFINIDAAAAAPLHRLLGRLLERAP